MFDNYYFEALILKRHSLRKVELLQLIDELMQRKSDIYNQLKIKEKQLERLEKQYDRAKWWLNEIVKYHRFTPISTAEKALKEIEELEK